MSYDRQRPTLTELVNRLTAYSEIDYSVPAYELSRNEALLLLSELDLDSISGNIVKVSEKHRKVSLFTNDNNRETTPKVSATEMSEVKYLIGKAIDFADTHRPDPDCETREDWDRWFEPLCDFHDGLDETKVFQLTTDSESPDRLKLFEESIRHSFKEREDKHLERIEELTIENQKVVDNYWQLRTQNAELTAENERLENENLAINHEAGHRIADLEAKLSIATDALEKLATRVDDYAHAGNIMCFSYDKQRDDDESSLSECLEDVQETLAKLKGEK